MDLTPQLIETYYTAIDSACTSTALIEDSVTALYPERFIVQALLILQGTMGNWAAASPVEVTPAFVKQFAEVLVTKLMPLRKGDLDKWSEDPEEWMNEEEADRWEFELRVSGVSSGWGECGTRALIVRALICSPARSMFFRRC